MKVTILFLASTLIFLFTSTLLSFAATYDIVYDAEGKPLERGVSYYISPTLIGPGVVRMALIPNNETCEFDVVQDTIAGNPGSHITFNPVPIGEDVIYTGLPLNIRSVDKPNPCGASTIWKVVGFPEICILAPCTAIVTAGGTPRVPESCFQIVKTEFPNVPYAYMLQYNPSLCGGGENTDYLIGTYQINTGDSFKHLSVGKGNILEVKFVKVFEEEPHIVI